MTLGALLLFTGAGCLLPLLSNLGRCYRAILNDACLISKDPALRGNFEIIYAYPGFWALFWYRLSHSLLEQQIPLVSTVLPRLTMSMVRYTTAIDIHPGAQISGEGILIDHGAGLVVGETAVIGGGATLYHGVTLGISGKKLPVGAKRHPTIGDRVVVGAGAKILGDIVIEDDVLVGANSVVTKPVPRNHTAVGVPARILCHGSTTGKDVTGAAICELHRRLQKVEKVTQRVGERQADMVKAEKGKSDIEPEQQPAGEPREPLSLAKPLATEAVSILLRSPREEQPAPTLHPAAKAVAAGEETRDELRSRLVLEKATLSPHKSSGVTEVGKGSGRYEESVSGVGEILYGLRVVGEVEAAVAAG